MARRTGGRRLVTGVLVLAAPSLAACSDPSDDPYLLVDNRTGDEITVVADTPGAEPISVNTSGTSITDRVLVLQGEGACTEHAVVARSRAGEELARLPAGVCWVRQLRWTVD